LSQIFQGRGIEQRQRPEQEAQIRRQEFGRRQGQESKRRCRKEGGPGRVRGRPRIDGRIVEKEEHKGQTKQDEGTKRCKGKKEEEDVVSATRRDTGNGKKKGEEEVAICFKCVVGFAIQVDKGNNAKGGFNKKISEGLAFLCEYLDKAACILPSGKDQRLGPIKTKSDIPKY
jgi:hypothetical protein